MFNSISTDTNFIDYIDKGKYTKFYFRYCYKIISISQDGISLITLEYFITFLGVGKVYKDFANRTTYMYYLTFTKILAPSIFLIKWLIF